MISSNKIVDFHIYLRGNVGNVVDGSLLVLDWTGLG
jgi:hypothetical protein